MNPTGDPELDELKRLQLEKELARISRNADRRVAREKAKGRHIGSPAAGSPGQSDPDGNSNTDGTPQKGRGRNKDGTARKCANCGQVGHIKTNRKSVTFTCLCCGLHECVPLDGSKKRLGDGNGTSIAGFAGPESGATVAFSKQSYSKFVL